MKEWFARGARIVEVLPILNGCLPGKGLFVFLWCMSCVWLGRGQDGRELELWYTAPATDWMTQALPFGNGYLGAMFFGGVDQEQIQFSEGTLWSGGPGSNAEHDFGVRRGAHQHLPKVRKLLREGKMEAADALIKAEFTGVIDRGERYNADFGDYGAQQTMADIFVQVDHSGPVKEYRRSLNIEKALGQVGYTVNGERYRRTFFGNYPSNALVYRFESSVRTNYEIQLKSPHITTAQTFKDGVYSFVGEVADNAMPFENLISFHLSDGELRYEEGVVYVNGAKDLIMVHTAATAYAPRFPHYRGTDFKEKNQRTMQQWQGRSYTDLYAEHLRDHGQLFDRVSLYLDGSGASDLPTNARLQAYNQGSQDLGLEVLYFQYARYLMIAGSRPNTMSMHLQGKWNNSTNPPWAADYHSNINLEMIYWPAELTNLSECHLPFLDFIESLVVPGKVAAKEFFGVRGWMTNTMTNAYGFTSTGWGIPWGFFPAGAAWFSQHLWDHYDFTQDMDFLRTRGYPIMREAALFWIDYLVDNGEGQLVSMPSYSPEHGGISKGASMDHQIAWDLLNNCIKAAEVLGIEDAFTRSAKETRDAILPPQVGSWGQLQEWAEDVDDPKNQHRHISHLFALHPGNQISTTKTPELAEAARVTLNARGDDGTGWSRAWKMNFWARLNNGDRAHKMLGQLLKPVTDTSVNMTTAGGTYPNLLCAHPPFQLDGNMGGASGMVELLLQSQAGVLELLPALPTAWPKGKVTGLKARGGFTVNMEWDNGRLGKARISGKPFAKGTLKANGALRPFVLDANGVHIYEVKP
ncbi:glycosyl hydrolase family 95 catalytic domain-containing protein [Maribacter sp. 2307ULW6-5]|uniref:glycoside hydrolase family 95 protein n=1 Tax=Maribacter sp. 2307ULW6-5 TaxID=3386275 RepID=UPI0039BD1690